MTTSISSPIKVTGVTKSFDSGNIQVLRGVDLSVPRGKLVSVCGPSGCGKSTLLHIIAGIESAENGSVFIEGQPLNSEKRRLDALRHTIGFIFQLHNLIVVADEPTGALDEKTSWSVFSLLGDLVVSHGVTMIMATHDMELAKNSDRVIQMRDGLIE